MKLILIALSCLAVAYLTSGHIINVTKFNSQIIKAQSLSYSGRTDEAIFVLADLYHYVNNAENDSDALQNPSTFYLDEIDKTALEIGHRHEPRIFIHLMRRLLSNQFHDDANNLFERW